MCYSIYISSAILPTQCLTMLSNEFQFKKQAAERIVIDQNVNSGSFSWTSGQLILRKFTCSQTVLTVITVHFF